jgi:hypothetical protein
MYRHPGFASPHAADADARSVWPTVRVILALPLLIPAGFALLVISFSNLMHYIPRVSADAVLAAPAATVTATWYYDGSRYLKIDVNGRRHVRQLPRPANVFDLNPNPWFETCLYRTTGNQLAFNTWGYVEVIADEPYRPDGGVEALKGAVYLGVFDGGPEPGEIVFSPANGANSAVPSSRPGC